MNGASTGGGKAPATSSSAPTTCRTVDVKKVSPQKMVHLTEKPVELAARAMQYSSRPGENVLDLFGGSGSTLMAAEQTGRKAFLMELDPPYCDVIVERTRSSRARRPSGSPEVTRDHASPLAITR